MAAHITEVIELAASIRDTCERLGRQGKTVRLVPTMGCLHAGHARLIRRAKQADGSASSAAPAAAAAVVVVVSIFVNPKQFNNREDFREYPNRLAQDVELCRSLGVDYVFAPKASEIYPTDDELSACLVKPAEAQAGQLEGGSRPGHFEGMLTVVAILFNLIRPKAAYFGEKDFQQLVLVKSMVDSLHMGVEICAVETVRDPDGLPLSSRNVRLNSQQRRRATIMYDLLASAKEALEQRCRLFDSLLDNSSDQPDVEATILASLLATQCLQTSLIEANLSRDSDDNNCAGDGADDDKHCDTTYEIDYLQIRCARHLRPVEFSPALGALDCQVGCVANRKPADQSGDLTLEARLLVSVIVANVRLLDNVKVYLNLH